MCDLCGMSHCPPSCPSYEGELGGLAPVVGRCALCDGAVHGGERALEKHGELLCEACAMDAALEDVLAAEGVSTPWELLCERLDWHPRVY
ncbi:MAG: hypothetical protein IJY22_01900 [Clostridia bacterium]|nr:hypothetical protein [Clostridia bacterium]